jgi:CHRD domain-containing protein
MRGRSLMMFVALVGFATACEDDDDVRARYSATLSGANERPNPVTSNGTGTFEATLDENNILHYAITFSGLTSNSTLAHIHGPATAAQAIGVLVNFDAAGSGRVITLGATSGTAAGTIDLNAAITTTVSGDSLLKLLNNGNSYVNIHSVNFGAGEIRGQIIRQ